MNEIFALHQNRAQKFPYPQWLVAFGVGKLSAATSKVEGAITAENPASILQMHRRAKFFFDKEAASQLKRADYYRWVFECMPLWQHALPRGNLFIFRENACNNLPM